MMTLNILRVLRSDWQPVFPKVSNYRQTHQKESLKSCQNKLVLPIIQIIYRKQDMFTENTGLLHIV